MKSKLIVTYRVFWALSLLLSCSARAAEQEKESPIQSAALEQRIDFMVPGSAAGGVPEGLMVVSGKEVRLLSLPDGEIIAETTLEKPVSYAAAAVTPDGLVIVGGIVDGAVSDQVLSLKPCEGGIEIESLPALPVPVCKAGAIVMDGTLFVVGGATTPDAEQGSTELYSLRLGKSAAWNKLDSLPGQGRILPALGVLSSELYVFGGWNGTALPDCWGFRVKPLDGTVQIGWRPLRDLPSPLAASAVYTTGQAHFAIVGGYKKLISDPDFSAAGQTASEQISIYHTTTDTWIPGGTTTQPIGGGVVVPQKMEALLVSAGAPIQRLSIKRTVKSFGFIDYGILLFYFAAMAGVGIYFSSRQKSSDEYALGGRNVKWWAAGISMFATSTSAISFMAIPALAFRTNLVWLIPVVFSFLGLILQAYVLFPLLRRLQLTSTFEYLERRFHPSLRFLASIQCIVFHSFGRMSVVLLLPSLAISAVSGISVGTSVLIMGVIATFYTAMGGFEAVIWTDVIQGVLMLTGVLLMIFLAINGLPGGWGEFVSTGKTFHRFDTAIWGFDVSKPIVWLYILAGVMQAAAFVSDQPTVQRVFSTPLKDVRRLAAMSTGCCILVAALITLAGMAIFAYFHAYPTQMDPGMRNDQVVPLFVVQGVPAGAAGLILAGVFAASLSTLAGSMSSVSTLVGEDFYRRINKKATDRTQLTVMKVTSVLVGCFGTGLAYFMSLMPIDSIFQVWNEVVALLGGGFVGIYLLGMFSRRASSVGAMCGAIGSIICTFLVKNYTSLHWAFFVLFAVMCCMSLGYLFSLIIPSRRVKDLKGLTIFDPVIDE